MVADLPADGDDAVVRSGYDHDAGGALVHAQVEGSGSGPEPSAKPRTSNAKVRQRSMSSVWTVT